jgi:hypothetical protein
MLDKFMYCRVVEGQEWHLMLVGLHILAHNPVVYAFQF